MDKILEEKRCPICREKNQPLHFDPSAEHPYHIICENCGVVPENPSPEEELELLGISQAEADGLEPDKLQELKERLRVKIRHS